MITIQGLTTNPGITSSSVLQVFMLDLFNPYYRRFSRSDMPRIYIHVYLVNFDEIIYKIIHPRVFIIQIQEIIYERLVGMNCPLFDPSYLLNKTHVTIRYNWPTLPSMMLTQTLPPYITISCVVISCPTPS